MNQFDPDVMDLNDEVIDEFADPFQYFHSGPDVSFPMCGIFLSAVSREDTSAAASFHEVFVRASDFTVAPKNGDLVLVGGVEYTVFDIKRDHGSGLRLAINKN